MMYADVLRTRRVKVIERMARLDKLIANGLGYKRGEKAALQLELRELDKLIAMVVSYS